MFSGNDLMTRQLVIGAYILYYNINVWPYAYSAEGVTLSVNCSAREAFVTADAKCG